MNRMILDDVVNGDGSIAAPMVPGTPFSPWPSYSPDEIEAVRSILQSGRVNYWTGTECTQFEREFAAWAGSKHAVSLCNGTVALELALRALGIGPGDEVVVSPRSFMASASCVALVGAIPVFADVDRNSQNITAASIAEVLSPRTRAIICVHLGGWPCDMAPIMALARESNLAVIEDCAQAHGARYRGESVGSIGHIGAWSFCQDKIISTAGEGGMLTTNDVSWWKRSWEYKDHGKSWDAVHRRGHAPGYRWLHDSFGTNWRMIEIEAAVGRIQLRSLARWRERRIRNMNAIWDAASRLPGLRVPRPPPECEHAAYRCYVFVEPAALKTGWNRDRIMAAINEAGVPCFVGGCSELYREKAFDGSGWQPASPLPVAHELGETSLAFLVHPTLTDAEISRTCVVLESVITAASA